MNTHTPAISVIIPIYNTGPYLKECIESVLSQSFTDYELILVDDGSTDGSLEIEDFYQQNYEHVRVFHSNAGCVSIARNMGLDNATGEYIMFIDSDDYILPDSLKLLHNNALKFPESDFIQAPFGVFTKGVLTPRSWRFDYLDRYADQIWNGTEYLQKMTFTITYPVNSLVRRSFINSHNIRFAGKISAQEDLIYIIKLFVQGAKGVLIKEPTYIYRFGRENSLTSMSKILTLEEIAKRRRLLLSLIESSVELEKIAKSVPQIRPMLIESINHNLTGCIGGCVIIHSDKEVFNKLTQTFKRIPVVGSWDRKLLALIYNISPRSALFLRKCLQALYDKNQ